MIALLADIYGMTTSEVALTAAILIATITILKLRSRKRPLDGSAKQYQREIKSAAGATDALRHNMEELMVRLEELSREINARIDTKHVKLEQSIADADRRIAALRILVDATFNGVPGEDGAGRSETSSEAPGGVDERTTGEASAATGGMTGSSAAADANAPTDPRGDSETSAAGLDVRYRGVYELADRGMTPVEIARELGRRAGEVELILNLRGPGRPDKDSAHI